MAATISSLRSSFNSATFDKVFGLCSIAIITPFTKCGSIDQSGFKQMLQHVAMGTRRANNGGSIIVAGSTGEQHSMSVSEKIDLYNTAVSHVGDTVPIVAGVASITTIDAIALAKGAVEAGCSGIMLGMPPYINLNDEEFTSYVEAVVRSISISDGTGADEAGENVPVPCVPILLYNNVGRNGSGPSVATLASWYNKGYIKGIKAVGTPSKTLEATAEELVDKIPGVLIYTGSDMAYINSRLDRKEPTASTKQLPIYGLTSILGNIYPEDIVDLVEAINTMESTSPSRYVLELNKLLTLLANSCLVNVSLPVGVKLACEQLGLSAGVCRPPLGTGLTEKKIGEIKLAVAEYNKNVGEIRQLKKSTVEK